MSGLYLKFHLTPSYVALPQKQHRLSPGDGLKGLKSRPIWL
jgi:hypothetical protein